MIHMEFNSEIQKLVQRFDKKYYPPEVVEILWGIVKDLSYEWLKRTNALFLGQHKPPLIPEFREMARIEKDTRRANQGNPYQSSNEPSMFTGEQKRFLFDLTKRVASRSINHQSEFVEIFTPTLAKVIALKDRRAAHALFKEVSDLYEIPYKQNDDEGPEAS